MDFSGAIGADIREVQAVSHNGESARAVIATRTYSTGIQDLWQALVDPVRIPRWFLPVSGDLKLGGRYQLEGNAGGEITRCDEPDALEVTWEFGGSISWVHIRLEAVADGTQLILKHILPKDETNEAHWKQYGPGATGVGWDLGLYGLQLYFDIGGKHVDREPVDKWMVAEDGKRFIRQCAAKWGNAHRESGADEKMVAGMVAETSAAYTGE